MATNTTGSMFLTASTNDQNTVETKNSRGKMLFVKLA